MSNIVNNYEFKRTVLIRPVSDAQIVIIDYGMGNLGSIKNMFLAVGAESLVTSDPKIIKKAKKLVLPGVGAFDNGMANLKKLKIILLLDEMVLTKKVPILGICLGMQLMTSKSEEGKLQGLGWIKAGTKRFKNNRHLKIPHMGWNNIRTEKNHPLAQNLPRQSRFYFVHSYYVICQEKKDILFSTRYGDTFTSAFAHDNIFGVQFHPEKSHKFGMQLFRNFAERI